MLKMQTYQKISRLEMTVVLSLLKCRKWNQHRFWIQDITTNYDLLFSLRSQKAKNKTTVIKYHNIEENTTRSNRLPLFEYNQQHFLDPDHHNMSPFLLQHIC